MGVNWALRLSPPHMAVTVREEKLEQLSAAEFSLKR
jgi:hypothetical protein